MFRTLHRGTIPGALQAGMWIGIAIGAGALLNSGRGDMAGAAAEDTFGDAGGDADADANADVDADANKPQVRITWLKAPQTQHIDLNRCQ
jgi:hypothetical protein